MSDLAELLGESRIRLDSVASDRDAVLEELAELLGGNDVAVAEAIRDSLDGRELVSPTAIGGGVAFPHARVDVLPVFRLAFLRTRGPVAFGAMDGKPVDVFVGVAGSGQLRREYLSVLSRLSYLFRTDGVRRRFREAGSATDVLGLLREAVANPAGGA